MKYVLGSEHEVSLWAPRVPTRRVRCITCSTDAFVENLGDMETTMWWGGISSTLPVAIDSDGSEPLLIMTDPSQSPVQYTVSMPRKRIVVSLADNSSRQSLVTGHWQVKIFHTNGVFTLLLTYLPRSLSSSLQQN